MILAKLLLGFVTVAPVILIAAYGVPPFFIQNDLEKLTNGDPKAIQYAEDALWGIRHGRCSQLSALICTGVKIIQVRPIKVTPSATKTFYQTCRYPYEGKAQVYGLFGIPSEAVTIDCDGTWSPVEPAP